MREGHLMLTEGVPAAMIENVGRMAGMPVGPLSLNDEVARRSRLEDPARRPKPISARRRSIRAQKALLEEMVEKRGRLGRKNGKGFYDYPQKRRRSGCGRGSPSCSRRSSIPTRSTSTSSSSACSAIQALETARCVEEGVITDVREADVGSILGFGFAPFTGGTLSYIDMMGTQGFVELCRRLER